MPVRSGVTAAGVRGAAAGAAEATVALAVAGVAVARTEAAALAAVCSVAGVAEAAEALAAAGVAVVPTAASGSSGSCGSCGGSVSYSSGCGSCGGDVSYNSSYGGTVVSEYAQSSRFVPAGTYAAVAAPKTKLTIRVPAEAKVTLAGIATKQAGEVREFSTDKLASGQAWQNYTIHVEVTRDGKTVAQDRQITLTGGAQQELSFDFGGEQVAQL